MDGPKLQTPDRSDLQVTAWHASLLAGFAAGAISLKCRDRHEHAAPVHNPVFDLNRLQNRNCLDSASRGACQV